MGGGIHLPCGMGWVFVGWVLCSPPPVEWDGVGLCCLRSLPPPVPLWSGMAIGCRCVLFGCGVSPPLLWISVVVVSGIGLRGMFVWLTFACMVTEILGIVMLTENPDCFAMTNARHFSFSPWAANLPAAPPSPQHVNTKLYNHAQSFEMLFIKQILFGNKSTSPGRNILM